MWLLFLGIALIVTVLYFWGYFLRHQDRDPSTLQHNRMESSLKTIEAELPKITKLLEEIKDLILKGQGKI